MPRSEGASLRAAAFAVAVFSLAFAAVSLVDLRLPVYNPEHRLWRFFYRGWGYWIDWYGRSLAALVAGLAAWGVAWAWPEGPGRPSPGRGEGVRVMLAALLPVLLAAFFVVVAALSQKVP